MKTMTNTNKTTIFAKALFVALPMCAFIGVAGIASDASAQVDVQLQVAPPPPTFVATVEPVYYNGQPAYWYRNHWYWRDGGGHWSYYRQEPGFLHDHRMHGEPARHIDEHRGGYRGRR
jgi:hypothetical protein